MVENEFIIGQNSTNFIVLKGDWENSAVFTYLHIHFLKINSVTIQIVNDIDNISMMFTPKNLIALPLLHFPQNSIAMLQYFNELESYWNIAIYCNNSINCNLLQYDAIKQRSDLDICTICAFLKNNWSERIPTSIWFANNKLR